MKVENQLGKTIKALRSDRGGEYISQEFKDYLKVCGIVQQLTPPYTPQHNGDYALETATYILHMVPTKKVDKTPYELWYEKVPNLSYLKVWGCEALVKQDTPDKLQQRSVKRIFIGNPKEKMGYYFYFPPENKIVVAMYTEFLEKNLLSQEDSFEPPQEEVVPVHRSARTHRAPDHLCLNVEVDEHSLGDLNESNNYKVAILDPESDKWTVGSKWFLKKKTDMDGIVHTYKARLVSKGYTQTYRVDYEETFSPVADIRAIRILIDIVAFYDYEIWQMDVKTAFLNGYLNEDIYMVQPEGFVDPNHPRKVKRMQNVPYASVVGSIIFEIDRDDIKSQTGYVFVLNRGAVDWKSSKQSTTVMSATEAEYIVASEAAMEAV
ncbi:retrotransposon protein, putative, ty1-copia subclass [Tanacetum coccineum]|uniref:Retrotransposon protein, putative, ty1-copia subclass n=1 Tax=Tanacetum coccineum TaxID=301880 RepID=A0ABQ5G5B8_9ASTR